MGVIAHVRAGDCVYDRCPVAARPRRPEATIRPIDATAAPAPPSIPTSLNPPPRTGREIVLATKPFARENPVRSWWVLLSTFAAFAATSAVALSPISWPFRLAASVVTGLLMVRLFVIYHDHQHGTILRGSRLGKIIMAAYGVLTLNPPSIWNRSHNHHHRNTAKIFGADIGSYPVMTTAAYRRASPRQRRAYAITRHPLTIAFGYVTIFLYGMCLRSVLSKPREHLDSAIALVLHAALVAWLAWLGWETLVLGLFIPAIISAGLGAYLFYAQHNYPGVILQPRAEWDYVTAALKSSSFIRMNPLMHWFTGNIGYHHVHHLNARIPFYRLPEAMAAIPELHSPGNTTLRPRDIWRCLRLKLWDPQTNALVPFAAAR